MSVLEKFFSKKAQDKNEKLDLYQPVVYTGSPVFYSNRYNNYNYVGISTDDVDHQMVGNEKLTIYIYYKDSNGERSPF